MRNNLAERRERRKVRNNLGVAPFRHAPPAADYQALRATMMRAEGDAGGSESSSSL